MLSIKPRQRAGEKGVIFRLVKSTLRRSTAKHYSKKSELICNAKKVSLGNQRKKNRSLFPFCLS